MRISGYGLSVTRIYAQVSAEINDQNVVQPPEDSARPATPMPPLPETEPGDDTKVRGENGVLRLLQEGHFKPHAEMCLREIFHRDLAILQAQNQPSEPPAEDPPTEGIAPLPEQEVGT